jgi:CelD/BcsL family acetyltransferase involved in cellulose biosynthesis
VRRTVIASNLHEIARLGYFWDKLPATTMFQSFDWNATAARVFRDRESPYIIYAESDSGRALIPAAIDQDRLSLMGETLFDYRDVLSEGDQCVLHSAWHRAAQSQRMFSAGALRQNAKVARWTGFNLDNFYGAPYVSAREITADRFASDHNRLARFRRRFERMGMALRCHHGFNSDLIQLIYQQKGSQPAETGDSLFSDPLRQQFMVEICRTLGNACEVFTLETSGTLVAAIVTFRDRNIRRFYTIYFDQAWAKHSPGIVLLYEVTRRTLEAGMDCDYMTGEHAYKMRFATSVVPMYWATASADELASMHQHQEPIAA